MSSTTFETSVASPQLTTQSRLDVVTVNSSRVFTAIDHGKVFSLETSGVEIELSMAPAITCVGVSFKVIVATTESPPANIRVRCAIKPELQLACLIGTLTGGAQTTKTTVTFGYDILLPKVAPGSFLDVTCTGRIWHIKIVAHIEGNPVFS
jgi:hypothetical protein